MTSGVIQAPAFDPIKLEIIRAGLQSIPDLIEGDLTRTAYSPVVYEYKDYAVGIVDTNGKSIAVARKGLALFLTNIIGLAVQDGLLIYGKDGFKPGDVILCNYAGAMGQHLNNVVMYTPIFDDNGELHAFMAILVHWIDIGGRYVGSCLGTDTTELAQEGLQLRTVKLYREGKLDEEMMRVIMYNTRLPVMLRGDINAQHAGCIRGCQLFQELMRRHGSDVVDQAIEVIWKNSAASAEAAVRKIPDGVYEAHSFLDNDGVDLDKNIDIPIKVIVKDGTFVVDFSDIGEQVRGPFNSGRLGGGVTAARIAFKYLVTPDEPANEGGFEPLDIILPDGKFLSAREGAPLACWSTPLPTVIDTIIAAMAPALPDRVAGGHHGSFGVFGFSGICPDENAFYSFFDTALGGWGGSIHGDGVGPYKTLFHGDTRDIPVESVEALYPLLVERYQWRADSAGPGQNRGGLGIDKTIRVLAPASLNLTFERAQCAPWGCLGGGDAQAASVDVDYTDGRRETFHKLSELALDTGDRVTIHSGGGGGYGDPSKRSPELVARDLKQGYITRAHAQQHYAAVLPQAEAIAAASPD